LWLALYLLAPTQGNAANISVQATLAEQGVWNSNPMLLHNNVEALWGSTTSAGLSVKDATPTSLIALDGTFNKSLFNQSGFNSDDVFLSSSLSRRMQRWQASLNTRFTYDTTRTSEETSYGTNIAGIRHWGTGVAPNLSFRVTSTNELGLASSFSNDSYDETGYTNYTVMSVTPSYTHSFDALNKGVLSFMARRYETQNTPKKTIDSLSPSFGWLHVFTPKLAAKTFLGIQTSREKVEGVEPRDWSLQSVFSTDLTFRGVQDTFDLMATRSQQPFANGTEPLATSLSVKDSHRLNENLSLAGSVSYQLSEYPEETTGLRESMTTANTSVTYNPTDTLELAAKYQYRFETLTKTSQTIDDHSAMLSLSYRPKTWTLGF